MRRLKVFGGLTFVGGKQVRTIVAAVSQKEAALLVGEKISQFRDYWSETGNEIEMSIALSQPGKVFRATTSMGKDFS